MKKKIVGLLGAGLLVCAFSLLSGPAQAALNFGGLVGWYSPSLGEVKDYLDVVNAFWDTDLKLEAGVMRGVAVEYELTPNFKLRGEWNGFSAETSDHDGYGWAGYKAEYKLNVNAYTLSGICTMSPEQSLPHYIGAGLGQFRTKIQWDETISIRGTPEWFTTGSQTEGPIGFHVFVGIRLGTGILLLRGEARYILAKVKMEDFEGLRGPVSGTTIDLGGLFLNVAVLAGF